MNRIALPLNDIVVLDRQRQDLGDIDDLAASIKRYGLIQPIVVNQDKRLIAGGRRLEACKRLGLTVVDVVFRETLTADELHELELEENVRRKEMSWQERAICIKKIHDLKRQRNALEGERWGMRETAEMLGLRTHCVVGYATKVAEELLANKESELWKCDSLMEAWRLLLRREEQRVLAELARRQAATSAAAEIVANETAGDDTMLGDFDETPVENVFTKPAMTKEEARVKYLANPLNDPDKFEEYYAERQQARTIPLSRRLFNCDSIEFMLSNPGRFDHIITDIPYGIDVEMMNQDSGAMKDISTVAAEHDVEYNYELIKQFFPAAYAAVKENAYVITWCDQMLWQYMYDLAVAAGFKVQRWPITWIKTSQCRNSAAQFNFTKATEIAIVCRKGLATMAVKDSKNYIVASADDDITDIVRHPFAKPFAVWEHLISAVTLQGQEILEPFAGGGSGVLSMLRLQRSVTACEKVPAHYNMLLENVKQHYLSVDPRFLFV
jgi:DNA modification methylase